MIIIGSQPTTALEHRPSRSARRAGGGEIGRSRSRRGARVAVGAAVGVAFLGGGLALAVLADDGTTTPGPRTVSSVMGESQPTELDVRGVPVWWAEA
jgi:hypothetical protein